MSAFADAIRHESRKTFTENEMTAYNSTGNALLDLFACAGSMRSASPERLTAMLDEAYNENPLLATKFLFYLRDIRGKRVGKGERKSFRILLRHLACQHPEAVRPNIPLIGLVYGRFDDLFVLIDTPCEEEMWSYVNNQFYEDLNNMHWNKEHPDKPKKPVSLLGKWLKTIHSSNTETKSLARKTMHRLNINSERVYRKCVHELRTYMPVVESLMSSNQWDSIDFERVPSTAMKNYRTAFTKHDVSRDNKPGNFETYKKSVANNRAVIHTDTLFPYDIVGPYFDHTAHDTDILELQWKNLPHYINGNVNVLVICDTSGSMYQPVNRIQNLPIKVSISLAIYFAERNKGPLHNLFMEFSSKSNFVVLKGNTLSQKIANLRQTDWGWSTNLEGAFLKVLKLACDNHMKQEELPAALIIISDMQIDACTSRHWDFYSEMRAQYKEAGYDIPKIIFWNVNAAKPTMLVSDKNRDGVQLVSGLNAKTFAEIIDNISTTAEELMLECLTNPRYNAVTIAKTEQITDL